MDDAGLRSLPGQRVRIELPAFASYDLVTAETLTLRIPGAALLSGRPIQAFPSPVVSAVPGTANYSGFVEYNRSEAAVRCSHVTRWSVEQVRTCGWKLMSLNGPQ